VPANDGGSPLIRTSEYIANSSRVIEHLWLFVDLAPDLHFMVGDVRRQMGLLNLLGTGWGLAASLSGDGATLGRLS
jgi:hypothetical protein